ncbi:MAG: tetratricopeptide repeat protein [Flavobacteriales bacterium]|nr:tetratricopeptide repeat protein [Flavobacteriales bacterium]
MRVSAYLLIIVAFICGSLRAQEGTSLKDSGQYYYSNFQFQRAIQVLEPDSGKTALEYHLLAKSYQKLGQDNDAKIAYQNALKNDSSNVSYLNSFADFCRKKKEYSTAILTYKKLILLNPSNAYYYKKIASTYLKTPYSFFAITAFENAIQLNPKDEESKALLVECYLEGGHIGNAEKLVQSYLKEHPKNRNFIMQAIKIAYRLKDYEDVASKCELFYTTGDSGLVVQKLHGIADYHLKEYATAIQFIETVIKVDTKSEILHYYLGLCYQDSGQTKKAAEFLEKAIDLGISNNIDNYYTRLGTVYEELGNYEQSIQAYKIAYGKSKDKILLYHLARNYDVYYKDKTTALKYYQLYLEENDTTNELYFVFSKSRIQELKMAKHFDLDTL